MGPVRVLRTRWLAAALALVLWAALMGCSAGTLPEPPNASLTPPPSPVVPTVPADGLPLAAFGFSNGPVREFTLPRTTVVTVVVDQPNNVSAVISQPSAADLYAYLVRALPEGGFVVTDQDRAATTLTFAGYGWAGSFTADAGSSAVLLRPA